MREQVLAALCGMGFREGDPSAALAEIQIEHGAAEAPALLRAAIQYLTPDVARRA